MKINTPSFLVLLGSVGLIGFTAEAKKKTPSERWVCYANSEKNREYEIQLTTGDYQKFSISADNSPIISGEGAKIYQVKRIRKSKDLGGRATRYKFDYSAEAIGLPIKFSAILTLSNERIEGNPGVIYSTANLKIEGNNPDEAIHFPCHLQEPIAIEPEPAAPEMKN